MIHRYGLVLFIVVIVLLLPGCLVVEKIGYSIELNEDGSGTATVTFHDIRSNAIGNNEFEEDKNALFSYILTSSELKESMFSEGKDISSRELEVRDGKLYGKAVYTFKDITRVEGLRRESGFIYMTMQLEDSLRYSNGQVVVSNEYRRILWDDKTKLIEFEVLSAESESVTRPLAPFYKK
ncbi:MAG: hypothetical protein IT279_05630 [Ignavibacteriaceae bacterium]|nr:hypothetical protein [Ignavibacteriaceae bacterium]